MWAVLMRFTVAAEYNSPLDAARVLCNDDINSMVECCAAGQPKVVKERPFGLSGHIDDPMYNQHFPVRKSRLFRLTTPFRKNRLFIHLHLCKHPSIYSGACVDVEVKNHSGFWLT